MADTSTSGRPPLRAPCPTCRQLIAYSTDNPWRPFCSERCRGIDFGAWANEDYRVPSPPAQTDDDDLPPV
ncbi:MAG: hypothetical protein RLY78_2876 [Pseudomonadota bacterium]|jgi:endogenous inhibitor of DNA gyrase (YacG/DUF329 family)|uniref:DNA gyrase inhibitor YacG n=1 Tax=Pseudaquabacterium rugosum TaxID=2984194 RepID=A0ABU9B6M2_9BURK